MRTLATAFALSLALAAPSAAQQVPDPAVDVSVARPAFAAGEGPVVAIDAGHGNFHTLEGRYGAFAALLTADGFRLRGLEGAFTAETLAGIDVLVIANAGAGVDPRADPPVSAFAPEEIAAVRAWVERGGSLLLIADHLPFAGAATALGQAFGVAFRNGYVIIPREGPPPDVFTRAGGGVGDSPVTRGRDPGESVAVIASFTGSAFTAPAGARPVLILPRGARSIRPDAAGRLDRDGPGEAVAGLLQGATFEVGRGRVAVFGEAAMFSAQLAGPERFRMGFNNPAAARNKQLALNIARWLARAY
ncbi:MAG: DUF4350 domain-containing protein [Pseudomonadota bacterium]